MSSFRRAPNVSQYIANLNNVSPSESSPPDTFLNDDVDLFATTDFIDFDMGEMPMTTAELDSSIGITPADGHNNLGFEQPQQGQEWNHDFNFTTPDFSSFQPILDNSTDSFPPQVSTQTQAHPTQTPVVSAPANLISSSPTTSEKRKPSTLLGESKRDTEETARVAAEEDKRRRNTAASARFRIKKKQREADLEKRAKEMTEKAAMLETKVGQLVMENKWLKSLITEKNDFKGDKLEGMWRKFESEHLAQKAEGERTDGVGTGSKRQKVDI